MSRTRKNSASQSWREINQTVNQRAMTKHGRRRMWWGAVRGICLMVGCAAIAVLSVYLYRELQAPNSSLGVTADSPPLRDIVVLSDGTLDEAWVRSRLELPENVPLVAIDLEVAKRALEAERQVRAAVVARHFPSTLLVTLEERAPILRLMVPTNPESPEVMLVARDGVVYRGYNYDPDLIGGLPWLDGLRLVREGSGFAPIPGVAVVADLLLVAMQDAPHLLNRFQVVSLAETPQLLVRINGGPEALFSPADYRVQLARLDYVLDLFRQQPPARGEPSRIDLSLGTQVVIQFATHDPSRVATNVARAASSTSINHP